MQSCVLSWHGEDSEGVCLFHDEAWSWEDGGQSLWEEDSDARWRSCPHLSSLLPPNVRSAPSAAGSLIKENTKDQFTAQNDATQVTIPLKNDILLFETDSIRINLD